VGHDSENNSREFACGGKKLGGKWRGRRRRRSLICGRTIVLIITTPRDKGSNEKFTTPDVGISMASDRILE
jgi:hypothetical protein